MAIKNEKKPKANPLLTAIKPLARQYAAAAAEQQAMTTEQTEEEPTTHTA